MRNARQRWAIAILAGVFLAGLGIGIGGAALVLKAEYGERSHRDIYKRQADRLEERLAESLKLTELQRDRVRGEIEAFSEEMKQLHQEMKPRLHAIMARRATAIESHLDPQQVETFRANRHHWSNRTEEPKGRGEKGR